MDVKYEFIKDVTKIGLVALVKVRNDENPIDIKTKVVTATKF